MFSSEGRNEVCYSLKEILRTLEQMNEKLHAIEGNTKMCDEEAVCVARQSKRAVLVSVRVNISSVSDIDTVKQEFTCEFFLAATWEEPQLQGQYNVSEIDWSQQWDPRIYFVNAVEIKSMQKKHKLIRLPCKPHPTVQLSFRVVGRFKSQFMLHCFPFDIQTLKIQISSKWSNTVLIFDRTPNIPCVLSNKNFLGKDEWNLLDHVITKGATSSEDSSKVSLISYSTFGFEFHIRRRYSYYLTNIVFMMFLISLLSFTTFFIDPDSTGDRLSVILTLLLTAVTFKFVVSQSLPPVSYLTVLDWYVLTSVIFIFAVALENSIVSKIKTVDGRKLFDNLSCGIASLSFVLIHLWYGVKSAIIVRRTTKELEYHQRCYKWKNGLLPVCEELVSGTLRNMSTSYSPSPRRPLSKASSKSDIEVSPFESTLTHSKTNMSKEKLRKQRSISECEKPIGSLTRRRSLNELTNKKGDSGQATKQDNYEGHIIQPHTKESFEKWKDLRASVVSSSQSCPDLGLKENNKLAILSSTSKERNALSMGMDSEKDARCIALLAPRRKIGSQSFLHGGCNKSINFGSVGARANDFAAGNRDLYSDEKAREQPGVVSKLGQIEPSMCLKQANRSLSQDLNVGNLSEDCKGIPESEESKKADDDQRNGCQSLHVSNSSSCLKDSSVRQRNSLLTASFGSLHSNKKVAKSVSFDMERRENDAEQNNGIIAIKDKAVLEKGEEGTEKSALTPQMTRETMQKSTMLSDLEVVKPIILKEDRVLKETSISTPQKIANNNASCIASTSGARKEILSSLQDISKEKMDYESDESSGSDLSESEITGPIAKTESDISVLMLGGGMNRNFGSLAEMGMGISKGRSIDWKRG